MNPLKRLFFSSANKLDINFLKKTSGLNLLAPFHHLVSDEHVPYIKPLYGYKNTLQFEQDLDFLLKHFKPVTLREVIHRAKQGTPFSEKSFLITFDDALKQVHEVAMPILLRKGVPAALFISPPFVENKLLFYDLKKGLIINRILTKPPGEAILTAAQGITGITSITAFKLIDFVKSINYLQRELTDQLGEILEIDFDDFQKKEKPFMSVSQVRDFIDKGFDVGAHSMSHPVYNLISDQQKLDETQNSMRWVSDTFNLPYNAFAFPHVDTGVNQSFFNALFFKGQDIIPDLVFGNQTAMLEHNPLIMHRFIGENPSISMEAMCKAVLFYNSVNKLRGKQHVKRD